MKRPVQECLLLTPTQSMALKIWPNVQKSCVTKHKFSQSPTSPPYKFDFCIQIECSQLKFAFEYSFVFDCLKSMT